MLDPRRKSVALAQTPAVSLRKRAAARTTAGRWSLFGDDSAIADARHADAALEAHARILLCRYGVLFRELLTRESNAPKWRDLLPMLRRLEARGAVRGGRFVSGAFGEQYALPEAVDALRTARRMAPETAELAIAATDPLNLAGILVPGERVPAIPGRTVRLLNGAVVEMEVEVEETVPTGAPSKPVRRRSVADLLRSDAAVSRAATRTVQPASLGLFS
jgi:ATP-dependent Lhr-like helicase